MCAILISTTRRPLALVSAYIHYSDGRGLDALASLATIARCSTPLLLVGADTNGHSPWWGPPDTQTNTVGAQVEEFILNSHLEVANCWPCPPTYHGDMHGHTSWIDVTLTSFPLAPFVTSWRVLSEVVLQSDHSLLEYTLSLETPRIHETRPAWRRVDWDHFRPALRTALSTHCPLPMPLQSPADIDAFATALDTALQNTAARHVPLSHRGGHRSHSWWSPHLAELKAKLTRARRRWQSTRLATDKSTVNACSRELRKAVATARQKSWTDFCETTSEQNMWDQFQRISRPHRPPHTADLFVDNTWITDDLGKAEALGRSFFPDNQPIQDPFHCQIEAEVEAILSTTHSQEPPPVTSRELHDAIYTPGPWKAPGPDGIPYTCLRHCEDILAPYLLPLFTASLCLAQIPTAWKVA